MLQQGGQRVGQALRILSAQENSPVVFHCAAGKDRTGLVAALCYRDWALMMKS